MESKANEKDIRQEHKQFRSNPGKQYIILGSPVRIINKEVNDKSHENDKK